MVKQWRKTDMPCFASLPNDRQDGSGKGPLRRIGSFYLAILLLFLIACIHFFHTCSPHWLFTLDPLSPNINWDCMLLPNTQHPRLRTIF